MGKDAPRASEQGAADAAAGKGPPSIELSVQTLRAILEHVQPALSAEEFATLKAAVETLAFLERELEKKNVSVQKLRQMLFGAGTETTAKVMQKVLGRGGQDQAPTAEAGGGPGADPQAAPTPRPPGHGRHGAAAYTGIEKVAVKLDPLQAGGACPKCTTGILYAGCQPGVLVRLTGQAPIGGSVYDLEKLRCGTCGEVFTARAPPGVGEQKYDAESAAMIALLKYGAGLPFHRLEGLQGGLGIPLPAATQWQIVRETAGVLTPALEQMTALAAQGQVLHNDDTTMKVLALAKAAAPPRCAGTPAAESGGVTGSAPAAREPGPAGEAGGRVGVFTSGIVSKLADHQIALFFTGHQHAGENLLDVLRRRPPELGPPIQMCDALSRNMPKELQTLLANCLAHGRRRFAEVAASFPEQCLHVLDILKRVYHNDATARERGMSAQERLGFHQAHSGPAMAELEAWMDQQTQQRKVEPNSALGEAIAYMRTHWNELALFLRVPGAPLDNNICERALKKVILHRKNAYFYKTTRGARVGDLFMSLIHTCQLNSANAFHYLVELQKHAAELAASPAQWMPWNYLATLAATHRPSG